MREEEIFLNIHCKVQFEDMDSKTFNFIKRKMMFEKMFDEFLQTL